jgi:hypothetical protein
MSVKAMSAVWERSNQKGSSLLVMLALADWGDDNGQNIYPAIETIARKTRLGVRAVRYLLSQLEASGELVIERNAHQNKNGQWTNLFRLNIPQERDANFAGVQKDAQRGAKTGMKGVHAVAPNPLGTVIEPHTSTSNPLVEDYASEFGMMPNEAGVLEITTRVLSEHRPVWQRVLRVFHSDEPERNWTRITWMCDRYERAIAPKPASRTGYQRKGKVSRPSQVPDSTEEARELARVKARERIAARRAKGFVPLDER